MIKRSTLIEMLVLLIAASILLMILLSFNVNAQELASTATSTSTGKVAYNNITLLSDNSSSVSDLSDNSINKFLDSFHHRFQEMLQKHIMGTG